MQLSLSRVMERSTKGRVASPEATRAVAATRRFTDPFIEEFRLLAMNVLALLEGNPRKAQPWSCASCSQLPKSNAPKKRDKVLWLGIASMPSTSATAASLCSQATRLNLSAPAKIPPK